MDNFKKKYLKYKSKYLNLKNILKGGAHIEEESLSNCNGLEENNSRLPANKGELVEVNSVTLKLSPVHNTPICKKFNRGDWIYYSQFNDRSRGNPSGNKKLYLALVEKIELIEKYGTKNQIFTLFIYQSTTTGLRLTETFYRYENFHVNQHAFIEVIPKGNKSHNDMKLLAFKFNNEKLFEEYKKVNRLNDLWKNNGGSDELGKTFVKELVKLIYETVVENPKYDN